MAIKVVRLYLWVKAGCDSYLFIYLFSRSKDSLMYPLIAGDGLRSKEGKVGEEETWDNQSALVSVQHTLSISLSPARAVDSSCVARPRSCVVGRKVTGGWGETGRLVHHVSLVRGKQNKEKMLIKPKPAFPLCSAHVCAHRTERHSFF